MPRISVLYHSADFRTFNITDGGTTFSCHTLCPILTRPKDIIFTDKKTSIKDTLNLNFSILIVLPKIIFWTVPLIAQDTTFHPNGTIKEIFYLNENGVKNGPAKYFDEQGRLRQTGNFEIGEMVGEWKSYHTNGQLEEVCQYESNGFHSSHKIGQDTLYYENGQLYQILNFKKGKLHGVHKWFHENGQLNFVHHYKDGESVGKWKEYYENGQLLKIEKYSKKGEPICKWKQYYENGRLEWAGWWWKSEEVGKWKYFYEDGRLKRTISHMSGKEQCYDKHGQTINCSQVAW